MITNDAVIFGILITILGIVFYTSNLNSKFWKSFYTVFPVILVCYFFPSFFNSTGIIDSSNSNLYFVASRYLLPCSLVLLTLSVDLKEILKLGPKAIIMFLTGTIGILLGGPFALLIIINFFPDIINFDINELGRGMTTIAGSWIGGGANQAAMMEVFNVESNLFSKMVAVDIICANVLLAFLLIGVNKSKKLNGLDSLLSIVQMPKGIPVGSVAIGKDGAINAALYAASILGITDKKIKNSLLKLRIKQTKLVKKKPK